MSNTIYVEFLYDGGSATDVAQGVCNAFESGENTEVRFYPSQGEFPEADKVSTAVYHGGESYSGELRPSDSLGGSDTRTAPAIPSLQLVLVAEELTWSEYPTTEMVERMLELVKAVYRATETPPSYVYGLTPGHADIIRRGDREHPVTEDDLEANRIRGPTWLMLFPPAIVETYGREFLLDAPVWRAEGLDDGAVLLVVVENPMELGTPDLEAVADYIGLWSAE